MIIDVMILFCRFQVRPPTFFQQCRDQQWYIHQLQALQAGYAAQIAELKDRLSLQMSRHSNLMSPSPQVKGLIPHMDGLGKAEICSNTM